MLRSMFDPEQARKRMTQVAEELHRLMGQHGVCFVIGMSGPPLPEGECETMMSTNVDDDASFMAIVSDIMRHGSEVSAKPQIIRPDQIN